MAACLVACLGLAVIAPLAQAQTPPTSYTIKQNVSAIAGATSTLYRSGSRALAVVSLPAQAAAPATQTYSLYDLDAGVDYTWISGVSPIACSAGTFSGDWGDPFALTAEFKKGIAAGELKPAGSETLHGIPTDVYAGNSPQATEKVWFDRKDGLVIRAQLAGSGAPPVTIVDITALSLAPPDPALFALPPACADQKPARTPAQLITDETGDDPANYVNAIEGPSSPSSCNVVLRVVQAKSMMPIQNIQVAIDTQYNQNDPDPPHYTFGVAGNGTETFSGGHLHELASGIHNGMVSLGTVPSYFNLVVNAVEPNRSGGVVLVYRHCFLPTTVLLYIVKNLGQSGQSSDLLWVKAGRNAVPPVH
jgi:hypothetical protein